MKTNPDQPADQFEVPITNSGHLMRAGLTLHQYYTGLALQGLLANAEVFKEQEPHTIVFQAVAYADLIIEELNREKKPKPIE